MLFKFIKANRYSQFMAFSLLKELVEEHKRGIYGKIYTYGNRVALDVIDASIFIKSAAPGSQYGRCHEGMDSTTQVNTTTPRKVL